MNKHLTRFGVWATTTSGQRKRLVERLGPDWADVLANRVQAHIVRLDRELNRPMPTGRLLTSEVQQRNRDRLIHGLTAA
ncbi:hypothetical protein OOK27_11755 [Streptomyces canus]|uniref:hypothetical protein n=1 Tax=Streptomyces canus TaxID=58343 RepID=UPI00224D6E34|nr:hypothetical protein [Streptomyces canus]MCX5254841.1 hypothetical protein [Streptomyces canus]